MADDTLILDALQPLLEGIGKAEQALQTIRQGFTAATGDDAERRAAAASSLHRETKLIGQITSAAERLELAGLKLLEALGESPPYGGFLGDLEAPHDPAEYPARAAAMAERMRGFAEFIDKTCGAASLAIVSTMTPDQLRKFHQDNGDQFKAITQALDAGRLLVAACSRVKHAYRLDSEASE